MNVGHAGWSPDYRSWGPIRKRIKELGPGIGGIDCHVCSTSMLVLAGEPPKEWKWSEHGWLCPDCARKKKS